MIMVRNHGAQVYMIMLLSRNRRQSGGGVGVNPSRPTATEAPPTVVQAHNNHITLTLLVLSDGMIMVRNHGAQVYMIMLLSRNRRQSGGGVGVNPSRPTATEAPPTVVQAHNNHMSSGTPDRRRLASR
jgi:hypothetical protein